MSIPICLQCLQLGGTLSRNMFGIQPNRSVLFEYLSGRLFRRTDGRRADGQTDVRVHGRADEQANGRTDRQANGQTDGPAGGRGGTNEETRLGP